MHEMQTITISDCVSWVSVSVMKAAVVSHLPDGATSMWLLLRYCCCILSN